MPVLRYLVLKFDGELDAVRADGRELNVRRVDDDHLVVEITEDAYGAELELGSAEHPFPLKHELIKGFAAPTEAGAIPLALPGHLVPQPSTFIPRVKTKLHVKALDDDASVAGTPGGSEIPVNYVAQKLTASYLFTDVPLGGDEVAYGHLREFDTYWEPLGWALDQWIGTISLAPFEDTVESSINVASRGDRREAGVSNVSDEVRAGTESRVSAIEAMGTAMSSSLSSSGWQASLGGPPEAASTNPLIALARGVLGTFQIDFGSARTTMSGGIEADLSSDVVSRLQQATTRQRAVSNESLARIASTWGESRRLRALRNLGPGTSANLALFSVARQWLVSTVEGHTRPVVLIKAQDLDKPFEHRDLLGHRAVLAAGLLDPKLADALDRAAEEYDPAAAPPGRSAPLIAERVTGRLAVGDPARGRKSVIKISARFESDGRKRAYSTDVEANKPGEVRFEIGLENQPLNELTGWTFEFVNPGPFDSDVNAEVTPQDVEVSAGDKRVPVDIPGPVKFWPGKPAERPSGLDLSVQPVGSGTRSDVRRILAHLEANRPYYRLLIDLLMDPVTRAVRLAQRTPPPPMPADLQPVGVAGAHLAFLAAEPGTSPGDSQPPFETILSTPAGGTFVEVIPGRTEITPAAKVEGWPTVALPEKGTLPWPEPIELPAVEDAETDSAQDAPAPADAPAKPEAALPGKIDEVMTSLETLTSLIEGMKAQLPKASEDGAAKDEEEKPSS